MSKKKLFDDDSEEDIDIKTENEYAKKYDSWREKEEIHKLEQKYGPDALNIDGSESSDSEDESDEPPEVSDEVETQFLKTLALLKTKDPRIYDPNFKCFQQEEEKKTEEKFKPKTLTFGDSDEDDDNGDIFKIEKKAEIDDEPQKNKAGTSPEENKKDKKIKEYLTGKAEHIDEDVERDLAPLKALWSDPKLNEGEAFLRDYILNKRYLEDGSAGEGEGADRLRDDADLEADEQTVEEQSKFERAYNFRFEEPDDEYLKRFPRTVSATRPKDERRARGRAERRLRRADDKRRKLDEIQRLKALKLKEIQDKIAKIKEVTGNDELAFKEEDIEGDFDPSEHDRRMRALFDEEYYGAADHEKPTFPDLDEELEIENWDKYELGTKQSEQGQDQDGLHCEDEDFNMDADYDPRRGRAGLLEEIQKTLGPTRRNRKRKSKLQAILATEKPTFLPQAEKTYDQYMEEYYKMDCEDIIGGDLPTRFKYREVVPNDYGLTVEEILLAEDRELTQWVPLKKIVKHRPEHVERGELKTYAQRAADQRLKRKMLPSLFRDLPEEPELVVPVEEGSKKKKKKKKNKEATAEDTEATEELPNESGNLEQNGEDVATPEFKQKKKKKKHTSDQNENHKEENIIEMSQDDTTLEVKEKKKKKFETEYNKKVDNGFETNNEIAVKSKKNKKNTLKIENNIKKEDTNSVKNQTEVSAGNQTEVKRSKQENKPKQIKISPETHTNLNKIVQNNLENKRKRTDSFIVEDVPNQGPSQESSYVASKSKQNDIPSSAKTLKRKLQTQDSNRMNKKMKLDFTNAKSKDSNMKFSQKDKFKNNNKFKNKQNDTFNDNPLSKLSDERLKAYGLNPKKYKNFLKYKKF